MNTVKVIVNISIPGRTLTNEITDTISVKSKDKTGKNLLLKDAVRAAKPAILQIKLTKAQYLWMTSAKGKPQSYHNNFLWGKLSKKERLHINIENLCLNYGGSSFNYEIIE